MSQRRVLFGASLGQWNGADAGNVPGILEIAAEADRGGLDVFTIADHLYFGGRAADGWVPSMGSDWLSLRYRESRPVIDEAAGAAGRDPAEIVDVFNFGGRITSAPLAQTRDEDGRWIGGSPEQWIEEMTSAVLAHRAGGFIFRSTDDDTPAARAPAARALPPRAAAPSIWPAAVAAPCGATSLRRERQRDSPHPPQRSRPRRPGQCCAEPVPSQTGRRKAQTACRNRPPRSPRKSGAESAEVPNLLQVKLDVRASASSELCRYMCR